MTLIEFCEALTQNIEIIVKSADEVVADFFSATCDSIIDAYSTATIESFTININGATIKNITVVIA